MDYDAIVCGGGHAGIEASLALARLGHKTLLITQNPDRIGWMSCNPAIGGISKGNLVREVDALGGQMGLLADAACLQFRVLNRSRGPAVQAPRAQADKLLYASLARRALEGQAGLSLMMDTVTGLILDGAGRRIEGVQTERGHRIGCRALVLATGTFLEGRVFIGEWSARHGRLGEEAALGLGDSLRLAGFQVGRLKTGTPARVKKSSVDLASLQEQSGDAEPGAFSFRRRPSGRPSLPCWFTWTTEAVHRVIRDNIGRSPLYGGKIIGRGPRYCPSIEDKVMRFPERERHQIFIEPEGEYTDELYLNGLSSSLPESVQEAFLREVPGLRDVQLVRPGYAVEYDFVNPIQLKPSLETKLVAGLFHAGQINGTSGYEEAAAQGILAGINAALYLGGQEPLVLRRDQAYAGVMVDDLVTQGTAEPYRMFTSRAEYRLCLRHDTADLRLSPYGIGLGLLAEADAAAFHRKSAALEAAAELLRKRHLREAEAAAQPSLAPHLGDSLAATLSDPVLDPALVWALEPSLSALPPDWLETLYLDARYSGYLERQGLQAERMARLEGKAIPENFDFEGLRGLSSESREKLCAVRPRSLGQAGRIGGIRQADLALLLIALGRSRRGLDSDGA